MAKAPEVVFVAITFADGTLGIMQFVTCEYDPDDENPARWRREASPENIDAEIARSSWDAGKLPVQGWRIMPFGVAELPTTDRTYRNAWVDRGGRIEHDMPRAREVHRGRLRRHRATLLKDLDIQQMRAIEDGDQEAVKAIGKQKQRLRDLPVDVAIEGAQTVEDLHAHFDEVMAPLGAR